MVTKVQKWGNSLGLRIPKTFAEEVRVKDGTAVDISVRDGDLVVRPVTRKRYELSKLLRRVSSKNLHREVPTGEVLGREAW